MNVENNKNVNNLNLKNTNKKQQEKPSLQCNASYNSQDGSLIVNSNNTRMYDAMRVYFINKDGSGILRTAWGSRKYPKNTFDEALKTAQEITSKNGFQISYDDSVLLLEKINQILEK